MLLVIAAMSAIVIGYSALRYVSVDSPRNTPLPVHPLVNIATDGHQAVFSNGNDEVNFEDDDSIYAFYGGARRSRAGSKFQVLIEHALLRGTVNWEPH